MRLTLGDGHVMYATEIRQGNRLSLYMGGLAVDWQRPVWDL